MEDGYDIFISYSTKDRKRALDLVRAFEALGWSVWIDRLRLLPGGRFYQKIDQALSDAKAVVVLWSEHSVASDWVLDEATDARVNDKLIPARLDSTAPPKSFGVYHTADLSDWDGSDEAHAEFASVKQAVADKLGTSVPQGTSAPRARWSQAARLLAPFLAASVLIAAILTLLVFRFRLPFPIIYGVPIAVTFMLFFLQGNELINTLRNTLADRASSRLGLAVLCAVAAGLLSFPRVSIVDVKHVPLAASLSTAPAGKVLRTADLQSDRRSAHWWVPVPPWGREVSVSLQGYDPYPTKIYPWKGIDAIPGEQLVPHPVVLVRLHHSIFAMRAGSRLHLELDGTEIAAGTLSAGQASLLIGGSYDLGALEARWREQLQQAGEPASAIPAILAAWGNPVACEWIGRAPPLDAQVVVVLTNPRGTRLESETITLKGPFTDVERELSQ